jgi:hypothetical protein
MFTQILSRVSLDPGHHPEGPKHDFCFHAGRIIIELDGTGKHTYLDVERRVKREFGEFKYEVEIYLARECKSDSPEIWQKWWTNQMVRTLG